MGKLLTTTLILSAIFVNPSLAQYYYKDIISNKQLMADMAIYKEHKIKTITVNSFEADEQPSKGFFCEKKNKQRLPQNGNLYPFICNYKININFFI